ncbi:MAG: hypothetical protein SVM80_10640 [Halobacteriota archaeon]|nr:hypothetical protein [Halobacteriota archaeon]
MGVRNTFTIGENRKNLVKTILKLEALFVPLYFSFVMYYTFLNAYFTPSEFNTMFINRFGEANFEFVLIPVCLFLSIAGAIIWLSEELGKIRIKRNINMIDGGDNL